MIKRKEYIKGLTFYATLSIIEGSCILYYYFKSGEATDSIHYLGLLIFWAVTIFLASCWLRIGSNFKDDYMINEDDIKYVLLNLYTVLPGMIAFGVEMDLPNRGIKTGIAFILAPFGGLAAYFIECAYEKKRREKRANHN